MARERDLTISEIHELNWDDGRYSMSTERQYIREMERGLAMMKRDLERVGHTSLLFDPMKLVVM